MPHCIVVDHPLVKHHLAHLRHAATVPAEFRRLLQRLTTLLAYEATRDLPTVSTTIPTPLTEAPAECMMARVGIVPILRAGLTMVDAVTDLLPEAEVWHLGLYRDESTAQPVEYYRKLPPHNPVDVAIVLDPMLATGGSAAVAIQALQQWGVPRIKLCSVIASQVGLAALQQESPNTQIYVCAIDPELNAQKFILPGLGDAGDRSFNTHPHPPQ